MGISRRAVVAAACLPTTWRPVWAGESALLAPTWDGQQAGLVSIFRDRINWQRSLPERAHGLAAGPSGVLIAPRRFASTMRVVDPFSGDTRAEYHYRDGHWSSGHAVHWRGHWWVAESRDEQGSCIGVYDSRLRRLGDRVLPGLEPHELCLLNNDLFVAMGGYDWHSAVPQGPLNSERPDSRLLRLTVSGDLQSWVAPPGVSWRHLGADSGGLWIGSQNTRPGPTLYWFNGASVVSVARGPVNYVSSIQDGDLWASSESSEVALGGAPTTLSGASGVARVGGIAVATTRLGAIAWGSHVFQTGFAFDNHCLAI